MAIQLSWPNMHTAATCALFLAQIGWATHGLTQSAQNLFRYRPPAVKLE